MDFDSNLIEHERKLIGSSPDQILIDLQLDLNQKSIRIWSGLPQTNFLSFLIKIELRMNDNLVWAASDKLQLIFKWNLINNQSESGLGCLRPSSFYFQLKFPLKSIRILSGLSQPISFLFRLRFN